MNLHIYNDADELTVAIADWLVEYISATLQQKNRFTIALSGGNTPRQLFSVLASDAYHDKINWTKMHIFWGDERVVPFEDERNNATVAIDVLLDKVPVPANQVHRMSTDHPEKSAAEYEKLLHEYFDGEENSFDLVMLGIGEDGHTLSVFPGSPILNDYESWTKSVFVPAQNMWRITLTPVVVNRAAKIIFVVAGNSKAEILSKILKGDSGYPASLIHPVKGELHWFVDKAAMNA